MASNRFINPFTLSGLVTTLIGNGIGRFAYIAMIPALIQQGWLSEGHATGLGSATLIGYIVGAPCVHYLTRHCSPQTLLRVCMMLCSLSFIACAWKEAPIVWFYLWRGIAGFSGAILMVLGPTCVLQHQPDAIKARISGLVFSGIGLGVVLCGFAVPALLSLGLTSVWLGIGSIGLLFTLLSWNTWQKVSQPLVSKSSSSASPSLRSNKLLLVIAIAYGLDAIGYLPHTLFWVDYLVRELGYSISAGGVFWAIFGLGAIIGPLITGMLADKFGVSTSLMMALLIKGMAVLLPVVSQHAIALSVSSLIVGLLTPGVVALVATYTLECVGKNHHTKAWGQATFVFALAQGAGGALMAYVSPTLTSYHTFFTISFVALILSTALIFSSRLLTKTQGDSDAALS